MTTIQVSDASKEAKKLLKSGAILGKSKFTPAIPFNDEEVTLQWLPNTSKKGTVYMSSQISVEVDDEVSIVNVFGPFGIKAKDLKGAKGIITVSKATVKTEFARVGDNQFGFKLAEA